MAKYRGSKGDVKVSANSVANIQDWELTVSRPYIEGTSMQDAGKTGTLDIPGGSGRVTVRFDYGDAAQAALMDILVANTDPTPLAFLGIVETGGPKQISCNILPTSAPITSRVGAYVMATFNFETDGAISLAWT